MLEGASYYKAFRPLLKRVTNLIEWLHGHWKGPATAAAIVVLQLQGPYVQPHTVRLHSWIPRRSKTLTFCQLYLLAAPKALNTIEPCGQEGSKFEGADFDVE